MVAIHSSHSPIRRRRQLAELLERATEDLGALEAEARRMSAGDRLCDPLCPRALAVLADLAGEGRRALAARVADLRPRGTAPPPMMEPAPERAPEAAQARSPLINWNGVSRFMTLYRRCGRRLCLALCEAREFRDAQTADIIFHLLHDLERQLWLVDAKRGRLPVASQPGVMLQPC